MIKKSSENIEFSFICYAVLNSHFFYYSIPYFIKNNHMNKKEKKINLQWI